MNLNLSSISIRGIKGVMMRLQTVIWKEEDMYVIKEVITGVTTQGKSIEEAINNLKEAIILYLEEVPEAVEINSNLSINNGTQPHPKFFEKFSIN